MQHKDVSKFKIIADEFKRFVIVNGRHPTYRELSEVTGFCKSTICSYINEMKQKGLIRGAGRHLITPEIELISVPIVDSLSNSTHIYEEANISDYIFISRKVFGDGEFGIIRVVDNSMIGANLKPNNHIVIKRQKYANFGQIVLAKTKAGVFILRRYIYDDTRKKAILLAENTNEEVYEPVVDYEIRGIALSYITEITG